MQSPGLCLLTDGLLLTGPSKGFSVVQSSCRLQARVVFGFSGESVSPRTALAKISFQKTLVDHSSWSTSVVSQAGLDCPISLQPDAFGHALVFYCKAQIRFLLNAGW